jgi:hypothetical protein
MAFCIIAADDQTGIYLKMPQSTVALCNVAEGVGSLMWGTEDRLLKINFNDTANIATTLS